MHRLISSLVAILLLFYSGVSPGIPPAMGQDTDGEERVIPPPPPTYDENRPSGDRGSQAEQDLSDPERAYDPKTGQNLHWDCNKKTWVDSKTGKRLGFEGAKASDGEIIPPPPPTYDESRPSGDRGSQAKQDLSNPKQAYDSKTGQNLHWDSKEKTWKDSKTGKSLGLKGAKTKKSCPKPKKTVSSTIKKVAVIVVIGCLIATAIAVPIAVGVGSHHHNNNADQQLALFHSLRAREAEPPPRIETLP